MIGVTQDDGSVFARVYTKHSRGKDTDNNELHVDIKSSTRKPDDKKGKAIKPKKHKYNLGVSKYSGSNKFTLSKFFFFNLFYQASRIPMT